MGLAPGWRTPEFDLIERDRRATFGAWRMGRWGIFLTRPQDFTSASQCRAVSTALRSDWFLLALEPRVHLTAHDPASTGIILRRSDYPNLPLVSDPSGEIAARWAGVSMEVGPDDLDPIDSIAYVIDDHGTIRLTYSFIPGFQHDLMDAMAALEAMQLPVKSRSHAALRAA